MNKFQEIRPIALGIAIKNGKILVSEGYDKNKDQTFYRCLGGGIEFLEKSETALKREFMEELGIEITVGDFLGISENIFTFNGKNAHELVLFYLIDIDEKNYKEQYKILDEDNSSALWVDINDFKTNKKILYPEEIFKYI